MIGKLVFPLIRKYLKLIIGIVIASALSFCMIFSIVFSCDSVKSSYDAFVKDYHFPDAYIYTNIIDKDIAERISAMGDVNSVNTKIVFDTNTKLNNGRYVTLRISTYGQSDSSLLYTYAINENVDYPNIAVSKKFLDSNGVNVGDIVSFKVDGEAADFCIGRAVTTPECVNIFVNEYADTFSVDLGYSYMPEEYLTGTDYQGKTNCITVRFENWADKEKTFNGITQLLGDDYIEGFVYENSEAKKAVDRNIEPLKKASYLLSISFLLIVSCVTFLFLTQIINQSKKDIAILRTLGYQIKDIHKLFSAIILVSDIIAVVIGTGIGFIVLNVVIRIYLGTFSIPVVTYSFNWLVFLLAIVLIFGSGQLAAMLSIENIKKITPKECFGAEIQLENERDIAIYKALSSFSTRTKYGFISIIKNKKRFVFSTVCITCVVIMVFASFAFYQAKNALKQSSFDIRMNYDYEVFFDGEPDEAFIRECEESPYVSDSEKECYKKTEISFGDMSSEQRLTGIVENNKLNYYYEFEGRYIADDNEIILNHRCAEELGAGIGDTVTICDNPYEVVGISTEYQRGKCYVTYSALKNMGDVDDYSVKLNCSSRDRLAEITDKYENAGTILDSSIQKQGADDEYKIYDLATVMIIMFALLIGYIIVSNTMQTNLQERKKELSVLRTIGYQISDISRIWLISTVLQIIVSLLIGLSLGSFLSRKFLSVISVATRQYPFVGGLPMYLYTSAIIIVFIICTHFIVIRNIKKWDIVEIVKEKD